MERIVAQCRLTVRRRSDPFQVDVKRSIETLKSFLDSASRLEDLCLDGEAIDGLSRVVELQDEWVRFRSSKLFVDPVLVEAKIRKASPKALAQTLLQAWRPTASVDPLTPQILDKAVEYWNRLKPLKGRWGGLGGKTAEYSLFSIGEALELGFLSDESFADALSRFEVEVRKFIGVEGYVGYGEIVRGSWREKLEKAYLLSFLVSSGRVGLEYDVETGELYVTGRPSEASPPKSIAVSIGGGDDG